MEDKVVSLEIIKISSGVTLISNDGTILHSSKFYDIANEILRHAGKHITVYDINNFANILFSLLPVDKAEILLNDGNRVNHDGMKIFYIPDRVIGITIDDYLHLSGNTYRHNRSESNIYDIKQFIPETESPDVKRVKMFTDKVLKTLVNMGMNVKSLTSPVSIYEKSVLASMSIPLACDVPDNASDALDYCMQIMNREWRSAYKLGYWNRAYDYDINACYPSLIARLRDIRCADWWESDTMCGCDWGIMQGILTINADVSPMVSDDNNIYKGKWRDIITTNDLWFINEYGIGEFQLEHGWFMKYGMCGYPFQVIMQRLYKQRDINEIADKIAKKISVGIGGKFAQVNNDGTYGDLFNPVYRTMITDRARLKVAKFIYDNKLQENIIGVIVDGVLADREVKVQNNGMGSWRMNHPSPALVLSEGYQWVNDSKPGNLRMNDMLDIIRNNPNKRAYHDIELISLNYDREYSKRLTNGNQLMNEIIDSKALVKQYE